MSTETPSQSAFSQSLTPVASPSMRRRPPKDLERKNSDDRSPVYQPPLQPASEQPSSYSFFSNVEGAKFQGGNYHMTINDQLTEVIDVAIEKLTTKASPHAAHDSLEPTVRPRCHPNTREDVLHRLDRWRNHLEDAEPEAFLLWLKGEEATGKSAIAESFAEICASRGQLLASFSFDSADSTRNHVGTVVASIAHQLSVVRPTTRNAIAHAVRLNELVFRQLLERQLDELVAQPLLQAAKSSKHPSPYVIVIDGLDHCIDPNAQSRLVTALLSFASSMNDHNILIRILITSRPTRNLTMAFSRIPRDKLACIALEDHDASHDIRRFLADKLEDLRLHHPLKSQIPPSWPEQAVLDQTVQHVEGRFGRASAIVLAVSNLEGDPAAQLQIVIGARSRSGTWRIVVILFFLDPLPQARLRHLTSFHLRENLSILTSA